MSDKKQKSPVIFAGQKFYDLLIESMRNSQDAYIFGRYDLCLYSLRQIFNMTNGFISAKDDLHKELSCIENMHQTHIIFSKKNHFYDVLNKELALKRRISDLQIRLYFEIKDLILKTGGEESTSLDWSKIAEEIE